MTAYECLSWGKRTRFEVESAITTGALHHFTLGSRERIGDALVLERSVASVACRCLGHSGSGEAVGDDLTSPTVS